MSDDMKAKIVLEGDASGATAALSDFQSTMKQSFNSIQASLDALGEGFGKIGAMLGAVTAAIAGGEAFEKAIDKTREWEGSTIGLAKTLGISTEEASAWNVAIEEVGGTSEDVKSAVSGLSRQIRTHEQAMNDLGLKTRDANGNLRSTTEIMDDAIAITNSYQEGIDRQIVAQTLFGKGMSATSAFLKLQAHAAEEARKTVEDLNLAVGQQNTEAMAAYRKASAEARDVNTGLMKQIGDALLPVLTDLAHFWREVGPYAIVAMKGAVGGLVAVFWGLRESVLIVWEVMKSFCATASEGLSRVAEAIVHLMSGDAKGAWEALKAIPGDIADVWRSSFDRMATDAEQTQKHLWELFANQDPSKAKGPGNQVPQNKDKGQADTFAHWKAQLEQQKDAGDEYRQHDLAADLAYWAEKLATISTKTKEGQKLHDQVEHEIIATKRLMVAQDKALEEEKISFAEKMGMEEL